MTTGSGTGLSRGARWPARLLGLGIGGLVALPDPVKRALAGPAKRHDEAEFDLNTQLLLRIEGLLPNRHSDTAAALRRSRRHTTIVAEAAGGRPITMSVRDLEIDGSDGLLPARLYDPGAASGLMVYFHGGGWVNGDLDSHDAPCRALAQSAGLRVLAVAYRLAPEHRYPGGVEDAQAVFRAAVGRHAEFDVSADRIGVGGDSAGGNLAAVVCQRAVAPAVAPQPRPAFQLLIYPATDMSRRHPSRDAFAEGYFLTDRAIEFYRRCYLPADGDPADPGVSPLCAATLSHLPTAVVVTAGFDPLRDEGEAYAARLAGDGVAVAHRRFAGYAHGFLNNLVACPQAAAEIGGLLARQLGWEAKDV